MIAEYITLEWNTQASKDVDLGPIDLQACATVIPYQGTVIARNAEVCQLNGMTQADSYDLSVAFADGESYMMKFWQQSTNLGTIKSVVGMIGKMAKDGVMNALQDTMLPKVFDANGQPIGEFKYLTVSRKGPQSYYYYQLHFQEIMLDCYTVGVDKGIYSCLYDQTGTLVAIISKNVLVKHGKSRYTMYLSSDEWLRPVTIMTAFLDQYPNDGGQHIARKGYKLNTFQKGLLDKYQPDFIEKIKAQEGATNLPENMPLVQQKVHESQNTVQIILRRIGVIAFIAFFVGIILVMVLVKR